MKVSMKRRNNCKCVRCDHTLWADEPGLKHKNRFMHGYCASITEKIVALFSGRA